VQATDVVAAAAAAAAGVLAEFFLPLREVPCKNIALKARKQ
jgi:hypothetical protein